MDFTFKAVVGGKRSLKTPTTAGSWVVGVLFVQTHLAVHDSIG